MNRKSQATILKLQLQVGLVGIAEINKWLEQKLISCANDDPTLEVLAAAVSLTQHDEMVQALKELSLDYDSSVAQSLCSRPN